MNSVKTKESYNRNEVIAGYLLILPAMVLFAVFFIYSLGQAVHYSLLDWSGVGASTYIKWQNYVEIFHDSVFWGSFINNWYYAFGIIMLGVLPGMILAYLLSLPYIKGRTAFRSIYFFPRIVSAVVYGTVWIWILDPRKGLLRKITDLLGMESVAVLGSTSTAMTGICVIGGWTYFGFCMVTFLAAFMAVDTTMQESAIIDGATRFQIFWKIIIPEIKPVINMMIVYTIIDSFKVYDLVLVTTGGGPNNATQIMTYYIYKQAFEFNRFGYGSACSIVLGICMIIFTVLYNKYLDRED